MMNAQRALLDELMGTARNLTDEEKKGHQELKWDDKGVCGFYMVRFCPHDLFVNTRSDLGMCLKVHDRKLRESFENSPRHDSYAPKFEAELAHYCEKLVSDLDRKVRRDRERLGQEVQMAPPPPLSAEKYEQLSVMEEKIKNLLDQVEFLGEAGKIDEAEALMRKVEILNLEKATFTQQPQNKLLMIALEKKTSLCETCGAFLIGHDAAAKTRSHDKGKQHIGYGMIRDFLAKYKEANEMARKEVRLGKEKETEDGKRTQKWDSMSEQRNGTADVEKSGGWDYDKEKGFYRERNGRGNWKRGNVKYNHSRNGRDRYRGERHRSRSFSPIRRCRNNSSQ